MAGKCRLLGGLADEVWGTLRRRSGRAARHRSVRRRPPPWRRRDAQSAGRSALRPRRQPPSAGAATGIWSLAATRTAASARFVVDTSSTAFGCLASSRSNAISAAASSPTWSPGAASKSFSWAARRRAGCLERPRERVGAAPFADDQNPHAANPYQVNGLPSSPGCASPPPRQVLGLWWFDEAATGTAERRRRGNPASDLVPELPDHGRNARRGPHAHLRTRPAKRTQLERRS